MRRGRGASGDARGGDAREAYKRARRTASSQSTADRQRAHTTTPHHSQRHLASEMQLKNAIIYFLPVFLLLSAAVFGE